MPPRDPRKYLWDALHSAEQIQRFADGATFDDYTSNDMLRAATERQFEIIGEALNQLSRTSPGLASTIPDLPQIVAFRNILFLGYADINDAVVWQAVTERLPQLKKSLQQILDDI
jgi:uncharacterized protein with HEPN domain